LDGCRVRSSHSDVDVDELFFAHTCVATLCQSC
jgi:hypothetical protein